MLFKDPNSYRDSKSCYFRKTSTFNTKENKYTPNTPDSYTYRENHFDQFHNYDKIPRVEAGATSVSLICATDNEVAYIPSIAIVEPQKPQTNDTIMEEIRKLKKL